jgi:hypothetical protein
MRVQHTSQLSRAAVRRGSHLMYVLEGDQFTIYPDGDMDAGLAVDIAPCMGIPAPETAPPFARHIMRNTGEKRMKVRPRCALMSCRLAPPCTIHKDRRRPRRLFSSR